MKLIFIGECKKGALSPLLLFSYNGYTAITKTINIGTYIPLPTPWTFSPFSWLHFDIEPGHRCCVKRIYRFID